MALPLKQTGLRVFSFFFLSSSKKQWQKAKNPETFWSKAARQCSPAAALAAWHWQRGSVAAWRSAWQPAPAAGGFRF
jgi:hypothetical protein